MDYNEYLVLNVNRSTLIFSSHYLKSTVYGVFDWSSFNVNGWR